MRLLVEHGAEPDCKETEWKQTPLSRAAGQGHVMIVRLLLGQAGVEHDSKDIFSRTPLWYAARLGHEEVARLLLEQNDVDPQSRDRWGRTPLSRAKENGHEAVVRLLTPLTSEHFDNFLPQPL